MRGRYVSGSLRVTSHPFIEIICIFFSTYWQFIGKRKKISEIYLFGTRQSQKLWKKFSKVQQWQEFTQSEQFAVGEVVFSNIGEECRSRFSYARTHDAVATVTISRQRRISKISSQNSGLLTWIWPNRSNWMKLLLENHIALLYLSVIEMDFNSFVKVRHEPVYHNQLFMPVIFCLLPWTGKK